MYKKYFSLLLFFLIVLSVNGQNSSLEDSLTAIKKEIKGIKNLLDADRRFTISVGFAPRLSTNLNFYTTNSYYYNPMYGLSEDEKGLSFCGYYFPIIEFSYKQKKSIQNLGGGWVNRKTGPKKTSITQLLYPSYWGNLFLWRVSYFDWNVFYQFDYLLKRKNPRHPTIFPYLGAKLLYDNSIFTVQRSYYTDASWRPGIHRTFSVHHNESNSLFLMLTPGIRFVKRGFTTSLDASIKLAEIINSKGYSYFNFHDNMYNGTTFNNVYSQEWNSYHTSKSYFLNSNALFYSFSIKFGYSF